MKDEWQPIETALKDGTPLLLANDVFGWRWVGHWAAGDGEWVGHGGDYAWIPTHWMDLPEPPDCPDRDKPL